MTDDPVAAACICGHGSPLYGLWAMAYGSHLMSYRIRDTSSVDGPTYGSGALMNGLHFVLAVVVLRLNQGRTAINWRKGGGCGGGDILRGAPGLTHNNYYHGSLARV